jgi:hypothetical protein
MSEPQLFVLCLLVGSFAGGVLLAFLSRIAKRREILLPSNYLIGPSRWRGHKRELTASEASFLYEMQRVNGDGR